MSVELRPMTAEEFAPFVERCRNGYAQNMIDAGVPEEAARAKAREDHDALLPDGVDSAEQLLYAVESDGEPVGSLWLCDREGEFGRVLFGYLVEVDPAHRGEGLGRAAMQLAEEEARRRGLPAVALNVFGANDVARGLYRSLGYTETAVAMRKDL